MNHESIRDHCLSLPHATEIVRWGGHLLFKVGGRMFAIVDLDGRNCSFKCTPEAYAELVEMPDILPASHNMWKQQWVTAETLDALPDREFRVFLTESYGLVRDRLSKKERAALDAAPSARRRRS